MALESLNLFGSFLSVPTWLTIIILIWTAAWKLAGLWKAAGKKHIVWFIVMGLINTLGIIPILYIFIFSKLGKDRKKVKKKIPRKKKKS